MRLSRQSTSTQTYLMLPAAVAAELGLRRVLVAGLGRPRGTATAPATRSAPRLLDRLGHGSAPAGLALMAGGYLLYKTVGGYRITRGGGPPGMSQGMPDRLVDTGPYAWSRNPMYLGHLTFQVGLLVARPTVVATVALARRVRWFQQRVLRDEQRLRELWGEPYEDYLTRVPRWVGRPRQAAPPRRQRSAGPRR